jgi:hypothetical protein
LHYDRRETKLLIALVKMVNQYLDEYEGEVDSKSMSAGEHAIEALADFGLMEVIHTRFGRVWRGAWRRHAARLQEGRRHRYCEQRGLRSLR